MDITTLKKIAALTSSTLLASGFIAYRSGTFSLASSHNGGAMQTAMGSRSVNLTNKVDSPPHVAAPGKINADSLQLMSSSKSIVLTQSTVFHTDSFRTINAKKQIDSASKKSTDSAEQKRLLLMGSSKLGIIYKPEDFKTPQKNTKDTTQDTTHK